MPQWLKEDFAPAGIEAKLGKCPDSVGNVLGVEVRDEVKAQISSTLQK